MQFKLENNTSRLLLAGCLLVLVYFGKPVLAPLCYGALLAMLLVPVQVRVEKWTGRKVLGSIAATLVLLSCIALIVFLLKWQLSDIAGNLSKIKTQVTAHLSDLKLFISEQMGIPESQQKTIVGENAAGGGQVVGAVLSSLGGFFVDIVLTVVYTFLFLYYRNHLVEFLIRALGGRASETRQLVKKIGDVSFQYISGLALMIASLWVLYGIGFSLAGLEQPLFFALLCGLLEIVPFVGNITGTGLAVLMAIAQGGGIDLVLVIVGIYAVIQFFQTYFLETLIVGERVNINPLVTIFCLAVGELIWGIPGMILAIPMTAILKIICEHVPGLKYIGFLLGPDRSGNRLRKHR